MQIFTAFDQAIKVTCTLASAIKPKIATTICMETKCGEKKWLHNLFTLFIINIQLNEFVEK